MIRRMSVFFAVCFLAAAASAQVRDPMLVSSDWLSTNLNTVTVLEVGDAFSYGTGHVPGARLIPFPRIIAMRNGIQSELPPVAQLEEVLTAAGVGDKGPIVIYGRDPLYATRLWWTLDYLGQSARAAILDGGITQWRMEGRPMETAVPKFSPAPFHAKTNPIALTTMNAVRDLLNAQKAFGREVAIIDARSGEQFDQGHIAGATGVPFSANYASGGITLKTKAELKDLYTRAGVTSTSSNVVYCRTGMQATLSYFVLKYIGYNVQMYDGSWDEWSRAGEAAAVSSR